MCWLFILFFAVRIINAKWKMPSLIKKKNLSSTLGPDLICSNNTGGVVESKPVPSKQSSQSCVIMKASMKLLVRVVTDLVEGPETSSKK